SGAERYLVRPELMEFLATVASTAQEAGRTGSDRARLAQVIAMALEPDRAGNAAIVLRHAEPIEPRGGFVARVDPGAAAREKDRRALQAVLTAGLSVGAVARHRSGRWQRLLGRPGTAGAAYLIGTELFETLLQFRASAPAPPAARREARPIDLTPADTRVEDASFEPVGRATVAEGRLLTDGRARYGPQ